MRMTILKCVFFLFFPVFGSIYVFSYRKEIMIVVQNSARHNRFLCVIFYTIFFSIFYVHVSHAGVMIVRKIVYVYTSK